MAWNGKSRNPDAQATVKQYQQECEHYREEINRLCWVYYIRNCINWFIFYGRTMSTKWNHDKFEVWVDNKSIDQFWSNPTLQTPKLISCANAYLIWCPYID